MSRQRLLTDYRVNGNQWTSWGDTLDLQRSALRWDIKRTMKGLCSKLEEIGEECFVVTVNVNNGWVGHLGTLRGNEYIDTKTHILYDFLNYCGESIDADSDEDSVKENDSDNEMDGEVSHGFEMKVSDGPMIRKRPGNIVRALADVHPDSDEEDEDNENNAVPLVEKLYLPYSSLLNDHPTRPEPETITKFNYPVTRGTSLKHSETKSSSSNEVVTSSVMPGTNTAPKIIITDVRSQQTDVSSVDDHEDLESEKQNFETSAGEKTERGRKRKREQTVPGCNLLTNTDKSTMTCSQLPSIPFSRLVGTNTSGMESSNVSKAKDASSRVLRSSNRKKGRQPILAYLLNRGKKNDTDGEKNQDLSGDEEELESMDEYIEEDDPKDEDWKMEKPTHRTSTKKK